MAKIKKILIANRGEIALRIMRTAHQLGIETVAVYSKADKQAPHVRFANEAIAIGPAPSSASYLDMDRIFDAARRSGADAIHPGYGFLSENADFAQSVEDHGLTFIGPSAHSIRVMGNKLAAKEAISNFTIPIVPGSPDAITELADAREVANSIGYPILIKAAAGGGGKGMRVVHQVSDLEEQMSRAIGEAESAFGDGAVFIEKYVTAPRHIEIQILADQHGTVVHLFERECSIQRRHQKVIEEAPSVVTDDVMRGKMGEAAIRVAKACNYVGAGTVEFLVDAERNFYFLEMNTRLQVEHPVTECITGVDLVEQQIRIAQGEKLSFVQEDLSIEGHALELRVYAEDPWNDFAPSVGTLFRYRPPTSEDIRYDDGFEEGMEIPIYYDPLIGKLVVHGSSRTVAVEKMLEAISSFHIDGVSTTLPFGRFVLNHPGFLSGNFNTHFIDQHFSAEKLDDEFELDRKTAALVALKLYLEQQSQLKLPTQPPSNWRKVRQNFTRR
ncbi:MAG: acetyl-CoA carboxylase biotin carboxylase subunit [Saprospiraceae bacterium]|nr:acetyl-CoA carboxylase biotin carboxylase subunit [Saprospiraceae bacterium]